MGRAVCCGCEDVWYKGTDIETDVVVVFACL
jgi:hypothetical protein